MFSTIFRPVLTSGLKRAVRSASSVPLCTQTDLDTYASRAPTPVTLQQLLDFSSAHRHVNTQILQEELAIRIAHSVVDLENLPGRLSDMPSVRKLHDLHKKYFVALRKLPRVKTTAQDEEFTELIARFKSEDSIALPTMAQGIAELGEIDSATELELGEVLDGYYASRLGIRMLIGQHTCAGVEGGRIQKDLDLIAVVNESSQKASALCEQHMGRAPEVVVVAGGGGGVKLTYVHSHLHHMLFELLKNSMRAVVERYPDPHTPLPPVVVVASEGQSDVVVKVSDEGGGIPRSGLSRIWSYVYTTAPEQLHDAAADADATATASGSSDSSSNTGSSSSSVGGVTFRQQFAGAGYGLPVARVFARYFGGDLRLICMEGYGTDAFLHIHKLGEHKEVLA